ncbi:EexN family lipoprotein [Bartonella sp. ML70XJBT.G]|uniref:EexN family lipoprotein n=1 Tax=Bartonella sp. ML70XJBT.G TaxID=3019093 RepID=UPI002362FCFC|nr:EexN family lipoprotein [Bartonella sp. ML70XJBT.G]
MNKVILTALLLFTGIITAGCEKTYSVAEFKKDQKLMEEWGARCGFTGTSKNCENLRLAALELDKERREKAAERISKHNEELRDAMEKFKAEMRAQSEKSEAEQEAKKQAEQKQDSN